MNKLSLFILLFFPFVAISAQDKERGTTNFQTVYEACMDFRDAIATDNIDSIKKASIELKACKVAYFGELRCKDENRHSVNGHIVFNETFANGIIGGHGVYEKADSINQPENQRGQTADGSIKTKTCFVKAGKSTRYSFTSMGHQELAVVAEAGGRVTMKVHATNKAGLDERYDDNVKVKQGMPHRRTSFDLPKDQFNRVELEVINYGKKDISFVVISN